MGHVFTSANVSCVEPTINTARTLSYLSGRLLENTDWPEFSWKTDSLPSANTATPSSERPNSSHKVEYGFIHGTKYAKVSHG